MDSIGITDIGSYRYRLTAVNPVGTVTWGRDVTGTQQDLGTGSVIVDPPPFNLPVTYFATDDNGTVVADETTMPSIVPVLSSQITDAAVAVVVLSQTPKTWQARSQAHHVIGRSDPLVTVQPASYPGGDLVLWTLTNSERAQLHTMLASGSPLLLRSVTPTAVHDMVLLATDWEEKLVTDDAPQGPRTISVRYQTVTSLRGYGPPADRSYDTWLIEHASWDDLRAAYPTWDAARQGA